MKLINIRILFAAIIISMSGSAVFAGEWCQNYNNNYNREKKQSSAIEIREFNLPSTGNLDVDGSKNGGISVTGGNRSDVFVEACVRTSASSQAEADNLLQTTRIETGSKIEAVTPSKDDHVSVSYRIQVPQNTNLKLRAFNGGLKVDGVNGTMDLKTLNGGLKLENVSGDIKARTTNGGVKIGLAGSGWTGSGLDVETVNGGVKIYIPSTFAANVESGTVNGGFKSDFPELQIKKKDVDDRESYGTRNKRVNAAINGGGARIRAVTTNGGVKIMRSDKSMP
jgi:hypothetical protein